MNTVIYRTAPDSRFALVHNGGSEVIQDMEHHINFAFLATSGFGTNSKTIDLAQRVVDFLNSLPANETIPYPFSK